MIWDTVIRSDVDAGQVARSTKLFVDGRGPFMYRNPYPYSQSHFTDPRLVASMMGGAEETMPYSLVPGIANQLAPQPQQALAGPAAAVAGVGILGAAVGGAIEAAFVYGVTRLGADVAPAKAKTAAMWAGGIVFGLSAIMTLIAAGGVAAATSQVSDARSSKSIIEPDYIVTG